MTTWVEHDLTMNHSMFNENPIGFVLTSQHLYVNFTEIINHQSKKVFPLVIFMRSLFFTLAKLDASYHLSGSFLHIHTNIF